MSSIRKPIQVPEKIHEALESKKSRLRADTHHEVIRKLIEYYDKNEIERVEREKQHNEQLRGMKDHQERHMIDLGPEAKAAFELLKTELRYKEDSSVFELLRFHFSTSMEISAATFDLSRELP